MLDNQFRQLKWVCVSILMSVKGSEADFFCLSTDSLVSHLRVHRIYYDVRIAVRADTTAHSLRLLTLVTQYAVIHALRLASASNKFFFFPFYHCTELH